MTRTLGTDRQRVDDVAGILKALGHPLRLRLVALLSEGDEHVNALAARLEVEPAIVSQQLAILRMHGLVAATRVNGQAVYRIVDPRIHRLLRCMDSHNTQPARQRP